MNERLEKAASLSRRFGTSTYVVGGGGNSSVKDADTLWVKPSGTCLAAMTADTFIAMDREKLLALDRIPLDAAVDQREKLAKNLLAEAVRPGASGRPSVEAPLHNLFRAVYVIHTHPPLINGLLCAVDGARAASRLFPDALWMGIVDPGLTLYREAKTKIAGYQSRHGHEPEVVFIKNHGGFVAGDTPEKIIAVYEAILRRLRDEYQAAGIPTDFTCKESDHGSDDERLIKAALPKEETQTILVTAPFDAAVGPPTPDHVVYMKAFPHTGEISRESIAAFRAENGYFPKIFVTRRAVFAVGTSLKNATLALEMACDAALIKQLAEAFGGIEYLPADARRFIENWEAESYRRQQA